MDPLGQFAVPSRLVRAIGELDEFKGRWAALGQLAPERLSALRRIATIESVGSSTRIEGAKLSDTDVETLLAGLNIQSFRSRDEEEVAGYAELMQLVFESWAELTLTENHVQQLHGALLSHSGKDERHRGQYKKLPNHVEAFDESGESLGVIFATATPFETPRLMAELLSWTRGALEAREHHPLLVIGVFVVRFLAIHPFQDGNGRLSRALTTLLLLRSGYTYVPYASLERVIEDHKDDYYRALRRAQATIGRNESQLVDWLVFFGDALVKQKTALESKVERERLLAPLSGLSESLLEIVRSHGRVTIRDAVSLTGASRNTVKDHVRRLVEAGQLVKHGLGRGTWYERR